MHALVMFNLLRLYLYIFCWFSASDAANNYRLWDWWPAVSGWRACSGMYAVCTGHGSEMVPWWGAVEVHL